MGEFVNSSQRIGGSIPEGGVKYNKNMTIIGWVLLEPGKITSVSLCFLMCVCAFLCVTA